VAVIAEAKTRRIQRHGRPGGTQQSPSRPVGGLLPLYNPGVSAVGVAHREKRLGLSELCIVADPNLEIACPVGTDLAHISREAVD
jgi:hypothetical protein